MSVLVLAGGLILLLLGGELVVRGGVAIGHRLGVAPVAVGLTVVALGTSAPELAVGVQSALADRADLAVGNVVGSNIANVLLVLGIGAAIGSVPVASRLIRVDVPIVAVVSLGVFALALDGNLARLEGVALLAGLAAYTVRVVRSSREIGGSGEDDGADDPQEEVGPVAAPGVDPSVRADPGTSLAGALVRLAAGIGALVLGSELVVDGASELAEAAGVSELVIGLTVVAVGTSSPEVVTTVVAVARGESDLAVGNAIGSCLSNLLAVLGGTVVIAGDVGVSDIVQSFDLPVMVVSALALLPIAVRGERIQRWEGFVLLAYYVAYVVYVVLEAVGSEQRTPFAVAVLAFIVPLTVITFGALLVRDRADVVRTVRGSAHGTG